MTKNLLFLLWLFLSAAFSSWAMEKDESHTEDGLRDLALYASTMEEYESDGAGAPKRSLEPQYTLVTEHNINFVFMHEGRIYLSEHGAPCAIYHAKTGEALGQVGDKLLLNLTFSDGEQPIEVRVTEDGRMSVHDAKSKELLQTCVGNYQNVDDLVLRQDGLIVVIRANDAATICNGNTGEVIDEYPGIKFASFSPDTRFMATTCLEHPENAITLIMPSDEEKTIILTERALDRIDHNTDYHSVPFASFSPDSEFLATACHDGHVYVFETKTGERLYKLKGHDDYVTSAVFAPDSKRLATAGWNGTVKMWDLEQGRLVFTVCEPINLVFDPKITFSPDGMKLGVIFGQKFARIYDSATGWLLRDITEGSSVLSLEFGPSIITCETAHQEPTWVDQILVRFDVKKAGMFFLSIGPIKPRGLKVAAYLVVMKGYWNSVGNGELTHKGLIAFVAEKTKLSIDLIEALDNEVFRALDIRTKSFYNALIPGRPEPAPASSIEKVDEEGDGDDSDAGGDELPRKRPKKGDGSDDDGIGETGPRTTIQNQTVQR